MKIITPIMFIVALVSSSAMAVECVDNGHSIICTPPVERLQLPEAP